jgi:hypothetical protein
MRRRQRAFFEDSTSPVGRSAYRQAIDSAPRVEPFPAVFCLVIMVLGSLMIYGAAYGVLAILN